MKSTIIAILLLVLVTLAYWVVRPVKAREWELRVATPRGERVFEGFKSEEDCYAFYESHRHGQEYVHGCYSK